MGIEHETSNIVFLIISIIIILALGVIIFFKKFKSNFEMKVNNITKDDIKSMVETGKENGVINEIENEMISSVFMFGNTKVEKVMTPRMEVFCIDIDDNLDEYIDEMLEKRFSRVPVYEGDIDNIVGILFIKDLFIEVRKNGFEGIDIRKLIKEAYFIPECNSVREVFIDLQKARRQIAIIVDEYGGFSGIVTIEDLIEVIMGDIENEYHVNNRGINQININEYIVDGMTSLEELRSRLNINIVSDELDTLNGYLISVFGNIPTHSDKKDITINGVSYQVLEATEKKIEKVRVKILN